MPNRNPNIQHNPNKLAGEPVCKANKHLESSVVDSERIKGIGIPSPIGSFIANRSGIQDDSVSVRETAPNTRVTSNSPQTNNVVLTSAHPKRKANTEQHPKMTVFSRFLDSSSR